MKSIKHIVSALILTTAISLNITAIDDARLLRFPDINNNLITFVYAGDIWTVNSDGGEARRLTSHEGLELFPKIYEGENWSTDRRSPLTEQGVDIREGDYIISINGKEITTALNPYMLLENRAGKTVEVLLQELKDKPAKKVVVPASPDRSKWHEER